MQFTFPTAGVSRTPSCIADQLRVVSMYMRKRGRASSLKGGRVVVSVRIILFTFKRASTILGSHLFSNILQLISVCTQRTCMVRLFDDYVPFFGYRERCNTAYRIF